MTAPAAAPSTTRTDGDSDELVHVACRCDLTVALCGYVDPDGTILDTLPPDALLCCVCDDLEPLPCVRCGQ